MPNWCYNNLLIDGTREDVNNFLTAVTIPDSDQVTDEFTSFTDYDLTIPFPCPEELQITAKFLNADDGTDDEETAALRKQYAANIAKYDAATWYEWQINNWGTKWAPKIDDAGIEHDGKHAWMRFDSAWSPPSELVAKLSELFPTLQFVLWYSEDGMCFAGAESFYAGETVYYGYFPYDDVKGWNESVEKEETLDHDELDEEWQKREELIRERLDQEIDTAESAVAEYATIKGK